MKLGQMARSFARIFACLALVSLPVTASAMNVSPMIVELDSMGSHSTGRIQVVNVLNQDLPYEVRVYRINFSDAGEMSLVPADGDFIVFPPQGLLKHNQRQMVRVQWVGGNLDVSRAYYVSIDQLPVHVDPATAVQTKAEVDVQLVYHMNVLVTVAPPGAKPIVSVESAKPTMIAPQAPPVPDDQSTPSGTDDQDSSQQARKDAADTASQPAADSQAPAPGVEVKIRNTGKRYAMLAAVAWTIEGKDKDGKPLKVTLSATKMGELLGAGYVAPLDGLRTFDIPTGVQFGDAPITVKFSE